MPTRPRRVLPHHRLNSKQMTPYSMTESRAVTQVGVKPLQQTRLQYVNNNQHTASVHINSDITTAISVS